MHEMALAQGVLHIVEDYARRESVRRVRSVRLAIGRLSNVEIEAIRFCFDAVTRGSVADAATLDIEEVPGTGWCMRCAAQVPLASSGDPCPECGGYQVTVTGGTEMKVLELELELEAEAEVK
jgi:hydrogenase nickel incorporation protein HypA/HybF